MNHTFSFFTSLCLVFFSHSYKAIAQADVKNTKTQGVLIPTRLAVHLPAGEVAERFGRSQSAGLGVLYKTKTNWTYGLLGDFWFGDQIKIYTQLVQAMSNENGRIFNSLGNPADLIAYQRGWLIGPEVGKIITFKGSYNPNSGLYITAGGGFMQHRIRLESDNRNSIIYQAQREYVKGFDRLNQGWMLRATLGYIHAGNFRTLNFMTGFEIMYGQSRSLRGFNYDTGLPDNDVLQNFFVGYRIAWFLPIYSIAKKDKTFYYK